MYGGDSCSMGFKIWEIVLKNQFTVDYGDVAFKQSGTCHHKELSYDILAKHYNVK